MFFLQKSFVNVRIRSVSNIVQQPGQLDTQLIFGRTRQLRLLVPNALTHFTCQIGHSQRMFESRMTAIHVHVFGRPELFNVPQSLKLGCIDKGRHDGGHVDGVVYLVDRPSRLDRIALQGSRPKTRAGLFGNPASSSKMFAIVQVTVVALVCGTFTTAYPFVHDN
eukprot:scaffold8752_cov160-Amphora_coffeaeformis.AAC.2